MLRSAYGVAVPLLTIPDELRALTDSLRDFIDREARPREEPWRKEFQDTGTLPDLLDMKRELRKVSAAAGFYQLFMPEEVGGSGVNHLGLVLCYETVAAAGSFLAENAGVLPGVEGPSRVLLDCTTEQRERYLFPTMRAEREAAFALTEPGAGSDATHIKTRADRTADGYVINGSKHFITHGAQADYVLVFAVTGAGEGAAGGITCFLVDADTPGFAVPRTQRTMYDDHQAELVFTQMQVARGQVLGAEGLGFRSAMRWINGGRLSVAAGALGIAQQLVDRMVDHAKTRHAFGQAIGRHQYVQGMVVDSVCELEQARYLTYAAADAIDNGAEGRVQAAKAKLVATEMAGRVSDRAIQVFGGTGFMTETGIERYARFLRGTRLYEGTSEILKTTVAKGLGL